MKAPNFFIVGAPKAGTSALYAYLAQHPQIYMSPIKEPNYFAEELRLKNFVPAERPRLERELKSLDAYLRGDMREPRFGALISRWDDYLALFRNATDEIARGEATACYLWSPTAPGNIASAVPDGRIVINLRNPVERAYSQYLQMVSSGTTRRTFREQLEANVASTAKQFGADWPLLEFGLYSQQVERYLSEFPRSRVHISYYEDLQASPAGLVADLFEFLGVRRDFPVDVSRRHHEPRVPKLAGTVFLLKKSGLWPYARKLAPIPLGPRLRKLFLRPRASLEMEPAERKWLCDYYRDDVAKLGALLGRDLGHWVDARVAPAARRNVAEVSNSAS